MRAMILYSKDGRVPDLAQSLTKGLEKQGYQVQLKEAESKGTAVIPCGIYDLVVVGSPVQGIFGGKVSLDIDLTLKRCSRLEGKTTAAFVQPKIFGTGKSLRYLMGLLESQGAIVRDFASLTSDAEVQRFAKNLAALSNT